MNHEYICEWCGNTHDGTYGSGRFCSETCKNKFIVSKHHEITCPLCGKIFGNQGCYSQHKKFCEEMHSPKNPLQYEYSKYLKWYNNIVEKRSKIPIKNSYKEKHHILPLSFGGNNSIKNLVYLTPKEHFVCHHLLTKIYKDNKDLYLKMLSAFFMMHIDNKRRHIKYNARDYDELKKKISIGKKNKNCGKLNNNYGNHWVNNEKLQQSRSVKESELDLYLSKGWKLGAVFNWNKAKRKKEKKIQNEKIKQERKERNTKLYSMYYETYKKYGFKGVVEKYNYTKTSVNLILQFHRYVKGYSPKQAKHSS